MTSAERVAKAEALVVLLVRLAESTRKLHESLVRIADASQVRR